jgi:hypothetical protein
MDQHYQRASGARPHYRSGVSPVQSRVLLPAGARPPYQVYVNGVPQNEGADYTVGDGELLFSRELVEPRRTTVRFLARLMVAGRYAPEHTVDVVYSDGERSYMAHKLPIVNEKRG